MYRSLIGCLVLLAMACGAISAAPPAKSAAPAKSGLQQVKLKVDGVASPLPALLVGTAPLLPVTALGPDLKPTQSPDGQLVFSRPEAIVRLAPGAKQMTVDGQRLPLSVPVTLYQKVAYLPAEVLKAALPDHALSLTYEARTRTVLFAAKQKPKAVVSPVTLPSTAAADAGPGCSTSGSPRARGVPTQEFGKQGAKVQIVAALPITHGCHVRTEAELKKAQQAHPNDVHLIIYDLFGPEGQQFARSHGGQRAVVFINDQTTFTLNGKQVKLEYTEGRYDPNDIVPLVDSIVKG